MPIQDNNDPIVELLRKYVLSRLADADFTAEDAVALQKWVDKSEKNKKLFDRISDIKKIEEALDDISYFNNSMPSSIEGITHEIYRLQGKPRKVFIYRLGAAAAVLAVCCISYWIFHQGNHSSSQPAKDAVQADIDPGGEKAVLTLADGSKIVLDSAANGIISQQGGSQAVKSQAGQVSYRSTHGPNRSLVLYNTLVTPRAGQYSLVLPDGTKVWLNAASALTFPTAFPDTSREVTLTGEAYFEVSHRVAAPFIIHAGGSRIQVLGTRFNVKSYVDDPVQTTTLLEGAIKISAGRSVAVLRPGERSTIDGKDRLLVQTESDPDDAIAWKNGMISLDHQELYTVMREIGRWYDMDIRYEGTVPNKTLLGYLPRNTKLSAVITILGKINVHCRLDGHTIVVMP